jgi:hypothetical protein
MFVFLTFFLYVFERFSVRGVQKHDLKKRQKVHVENCFRENSQKIDKNFDVSFSSTSFVLLRFQVLLSDGSSKTLQKTFYKKNRVEKFLRKNRQKNLFPIFS